MKNTRLTRLLLCSFTLTIFTRAFAFQVADGTPPSTAPAAKYIFYWGKHQCDLSEANGYKASLSLTAGNFRQKLTSEPKLWNGKELLKHLTFKLEDISVSVDNYSSQVAALDARLIPLAKPGKVIHLTALQLDEGVMGAIDFTIQAMDAEEEKMVVSYSSTRNNTFINDQFLDNAVWGREDIYETKDRDFFTVSEFWQTIRQEPVATWKTFVKPELLRTEINFAAKDLTSFGLVTNLEEGAYRDMLQNLEHYRYMVQPGSTISLELKTAAQYDLLYKKMMVIVADNDPRLRLRRKRDQHEFRLKWGEWEERAEELYFSELSDVNGEAIQINRPISRNSALGFFDDRRINWGKTKPECLIDGEPVSGNLRFRVTVADSVIFQVDAANYEADSIMRLFARTDLVINTLRIDSVQVEGYNLPPMTFNVWTQKINLGPMVPNKFEDLQKAAEKPSTIKFIGINPSSTELEFEAELPERTPVVLSIFEPEGWLDYVSNDNYAGGKIKIKVPRNEMRSKGKHLAFLNTTFGVMRVVFEVD